MPGFDRNRVVGVSDEDLQEFSCGICLEIFVDPMVTQCCRQTYCSQCIHSWLLGHNTCPNDRKLMQTESLVPAPRFVSNILNNMKVKCDFHGNGCQKVIKMCELTEHGFQCGFNGDLKCKTCGFIKLNDRHNCVENLLIVNKTISTENERLKTECKDSSMLGVIGRARHHLNKYHIESKFWSIAEAGYDLRTSISVSIDAILNNNSYKDISTHIINALNGCEEGTGCWSKRWNCVVLSRSGGESDICAVDDYFRVSFGDLFIVIFSVPNH